MYILIIVLWGYNSAVSTTAEFANKQSCENAKNKIIELNEHAKKIVFCTEK